MGIDLEIFPVVSRPNKRHVRVSRTKYSRTTLFLLKYLKNYYFHFRGSENFDFFYIYSNLADEFRSKRCHPTTYARLHLSK